MTKNLVFIGDSLTDGGEIARLTGEFARKLESVDLSFPVIPLASAGYANGLFTNGEDGPDGAKVYSQILPGLLGVDDDHVLNVARGGSIAGGVLTISDLIGPNDLAALVGEIIGVDALDPMDVDLNLLPDFVKAFLGERLDVAGQVAAIAADAPPADEETTAIIFAGLNDFGNLGLAATPEQGLETVGGIVTGTFAAADALIDLGVDEIVFYTFPQLTFFPTQVDPDPTDPANAATLAAAEAANALVDLHTAAIKSGAFLLGLSPEVDTKVVDLGIITDEIDADMETFGFVAKGPKIFGSGVPESLTAPSFEANMDPVVVAAAPDQVVFYDNLHWSVGAHEVIAAYSEASLTKVERVLSDDDDVSLIGLLDNLIFAKAGDDLVRLGLGDDVGFGGTGDDAVFGGLGGDVVSGGSGRDFLHGGASADLLAGGLGADALRGGKGGDVLIGGAGRDVMHGGRGDDLFVYVATEDGGADVIRGGSGHDALIIVSDDLDVTAEELGLNVDRGTTIHVVAERSDVAAKALEIGFDDLDLVRDADLWGFV